MGEFIQPFDFQKIFGEYFLGSSELIIYALIILISYVCAKNGMSNTIFLIILVLASLLFAGFLGQAIYILILIIIGFVSFKAISRLFT